MSISTDETGPLPEGYARLEWSHGFGAVVGPFYERIGGPFGYARAFRVAARHVNGMNAAHGGMLLTFADMAFGHAVSLREQMWWVTVRLSCDFLASAQIGDWVEGAGEVVSVEGDLVTVRGRIWTCERTLMTGTGLFKEIAPRDLTRHPR